MEENGIKRAQRRLEEQRRELRHTNEEQHGAIDRYSTIEGAGEIAQMPSYGNNAPSFETIEPFAVHQGFLEELTASYRATEEIYTRAHAELDKRRLEAQKKSSIEFTKMLEEWEKQVTTIEDPKQRKALQEAIMGCRRGLLFGHAAELNRSSQSAQRNVVNDPLSEETRSSLSPNQALMQNPLVSRRAKQDWDNFTNTSDVRSFSLLEGANSHLVVFETIASRYGTRNYSPDALKLAHGSGLASDVLAQITKPGEISAILNRPENIDHPLANAIREVMERMTAGNLKQQEIYELCTNEIDTFALSRQLGLDVAAIREELRDQELIIVKKETLIDRVQNAIGGLFKGRSVVEQTRSSNSSVAKAPRKNPAKSLEIEGPDFN